MKKTAILSVIICFSVLFSACTLPGQVKKEPLQEVSVTIESPTPTLNQDSSLDQIEADLKASIVLEEDFNDLK
jgi:PBP1b-binding outer membrane lipoprotein LpoB